MRIKLTLILLLVSTNVFSEGFVGGVPTAIMKTDYSGLHSIHVTLDKAINAGSCTSGGGLVVHDNNESSKEALTFALTALASGKKFNCYVTSTCAQITGASTTYPVCEYYPKISN